MRIIPAKTPSLPPSALLMLNGFLSCLVLLAAGCRDQAVQPRNLTAPAVTVAVPIQREVADYEDFTGHVAAVESVDIRARVTGYLDRVCFQDGAEVKKGDLLYEIDPRPFQAKYDIALAQIKLCEANLKLRQSDLARAKKLIVDNAISQSDFDQTVAQHDQAVAALAGAQAEAAAAKLNLDFTKLYSPIDGEISRTLITQGNLVNADQTLLTTVVSVDPMYVYFDADENTILRIQRDVREGKIKLEKIKLEQYDLIPVRMGLQTEQGHPHRGFLDFADNKYDAMTGTIQVRGRFDNPKPPRGMRELRPGNFARVRLDVGAPHQALLVAERAILSDQGKKYLLVVDEKNTAEYRAVKLGVLEGQLRVIEEGIKPGEKIIVDGLQRVRPGMTVAPKLVEMSSFELSDENADAGDKKNKKESESDLKEAHSPHPNPLPKGEGTDSSPHPNPLPKGEGAVASPRPLAGEGPGVRASGDVHSAHTSDSPHPNPLPKGEGTDSSPHPDPLPKGEGTSVTKPTPTKNK